MDELGATTPNIFFVLESPTLLNLQFGSWAVKLSAAFRNRPKERFSTKILLQGADNRFPLITQFLENCRPKRKYDWAASELINLIVFHFYFSPAWQAEFCCQIGKISEINCKLYSFPNILESDAFLGTCLLKRSWIICLLIFFLSECWLISFYSL